MLYIYIWGSQCTLWRLMDDTSQQVSSKSYCYCYFSSIEDYSRFGVIDWCDIWLFVSSSEIEGVPCCPLMLFKEQQEDTRIFISLFYISTSTISDMLLYYAHENAIETLGMVFKCLSSIANFYHSSHDSCILPLFFCYLPHGIHSIWTRLSSSTWLYLSLATNNIIHIRVTVLVSMKT